MLAGLAAVLLGAGISCSASPVFGPGLAHSGIGVHLLLVLPEDNLVIVHRVNTFEPWTLTGEDHLPLVGQIVKARIR